MKVKKNSGFTLIELLIVIGLLGALTALVLPSLSADREEALGDICNYNQAGTVRTLKQYKQLTGVYPNDMHTCLQSNASSALTMTGVPDAQKENMTETDGVYNYTPSVLSQAEVDSLANAGIEYLCYGEGLGSEETNTSSYVVKVTSTWVDDANNFYTFDGRKIAEWQTADMDGDKTADTGEVIALWIAPTTNWNSAAGDNSDWGHGNVSLGIDMEGQCPIPATDVDGDEVTFAYYMAYFWVDNANTGDNAIPAVLIGSSCPECGVLNP